MSPFREYINASTLSDVMGDRSKSRTRLMYQEFQTLPRVIQYYWLSHQSQSHQQVSFLSLTVSDAVESLISFQYQEENMTKTTKNIKADLLVYRSKFFFWRKEDEEKERKDILSKKHNTSLLHAVKTSQEIVWSKYSISRKTVFVCCNLKLRKKIYITSISFALHTFLPKMVVV